MRKALALALGLLSVFGYDFRVFAVDDDGKTVKSGTSEYFDNQKDAEKSLAGTGFFSSLKPFAFGARQTVPADIKTKFDIPNLGPGDPHKSYQVILQPGHFGRTSGRTGGAGANVTEQELVAFIIAKTAAYLIANNIDVLTISADEINKTGLHADIFLAVHADTAKKPCTTGPSLGYAKGSSLLGMHSIGFALATSMGQTYADFKKDNFTVGEHEYYAFKFITTKGYGGLLELGELTCPAVENALISNAELIAHNLGVALKASVEIVEASEPSKGG